LTTFVIAQMIRRVSKKFTAILLIFGWVSLSGFDVVEDLDGISGQAALSSASSADSSRTRLHDWTPLANNIVESANRIPHTCAALFSFTPIPIDCEALLEFRRHSQLHKLYRVFLI
jgi:hypothetical protein